MSITFREKIAKKPEKSMFAAIFDVEKNDIHSRKKRPLAGGLLTLLKRARKEDKYKMNYTININAKQITIQNVKIELKNEGKTNAFSEFPEDKIKSLLENDYTPKKKDNMHLSRAYSVAQITNGIDKAQRLAMCSRWLEFAVNEDAGKYRLTKTSSCHVRLCPVCQWRRSINTYRNTARIYTKPELQRCKHLFLTLTQKNVPENQLGAELTKISKAFTKLMKRKEIREVVKGYMRSTEVTRNKKTGTYHPHIHAILTVPKSYGSREYIRKDRFAEMWAEIQHLEYSPVVDIRAIKKMDGKALAEIAKYSVKPSDYLMQNETETARIIETLDAALDGKRFISYGGIVRDVKRQILGNKDIEDEESEVISEFEEWEKAVYEWHFGTQTYNKIL